MNEREKLRKEIVEKIGLKHSLWGLAARSVEDGEQEEELLMICYDEAHIKSFQEHLGKELFNDLINYNVVYNNKSAINFTINK